MEYFNLLNRICETLADLYWDPSDFARLVEVSGFNLKQLVIPGNASPTGRWWAVLRAGNESQIKKLLEEAAKEFDTEPRIKECIVQLVRWIESKKPLSEREKALKELMNAYSLGPVEMGGAPIRVKSRQSLGAAAPQPQRRALARLDEFIDNSPFPYLLVIGHHGEERRKLLKGWLKTRQGKEDRPCYHFVEEELSHKEEVALGKLCEQLAEFHRLGGKIPTDPKTLQDLYPKLLCLPPNETEKLIVVLDGLDEVSWFRGDTFFPSENLQGLKVIIGVPADSGTNWVRTLNLPTRLTKRIEIAPLWRRLVWRFREWGWAALALVATALTLMALLEIGPFAPQLGWKPMGLKMGGANGSRIATTSDVILVSSMTDSPGLATRDTGLWRWDRESEEWTKPHIPDLAITQEGDAFYAAFHSFAVLPQPSQDVFAATSHVGLLHSQDGGNKWLSVTSPAQSLGKVVVLPTSGYLFVTPHDLPGLYRSMDGGERWENLTAVASCGGDAAGSLPEPLAVKSMLTVSDTLYIGSGDIGGVVSETDGLYRSEDGGSCWTRIDDAEQRYAYMALAPIPGQTGDLIVAMFDTRLWQTHLWHIKPGMPRASPLWSTPAATGGLYVVGGTPPVWFFVDLNWATVTRGQVDESNPAAERFSSPAFRLHCVLHFLKACGFGFAPNPLAPPGSDPLLLVNSQVYRLEMIPWHQRLYPR